MKEHESEKNSPRRLGIILAGGRSHRMGEDKASLVFQGNTLLEHAIQLLDVCGCSDIRISGRDGSTRGHCGVADQFKNMGPVGGLVSVIEANRHDLSEGDVLLIIPVDQPLLTAELLTAMVDAAQGHAGCSVFGMPLPLVLIVSDALFQRCAEAGHSFVQGDAWSMRQFVHPFSIDHYPCSDQLKTTMFNVNTPDQWALLRDGLF